MKLEIEEELAKFVIGKQDCSIKEITVNNITREKYGSKSLMIGTNQDDIQQTISNMKGDPGEERVSPRHPPHVYGVPMPEHESHNGWFPHFFNTAAYGVDSMHKEECKRFLKWHSEQTETFCFEDKLRLYCWSDVGILRESIMSSRDLIIEMTANGITKWSSH